MIQGWFKLENETELKQNLVTIAILLNMLFSARNRDKNNPAEKPNMFGSINNEIIIARAPANHMLAKSYCAIMSNLDAVLIYSISGNSSHSPD
jgi:hypothetical protein